jgi:hypothetical protein
VVCTTWTVQYIDGPNTDLWNSNWWNNVAASMAWGALYEPTTGTTFWYGTLDQFGCTPPISLPFAATYRFFQWTSISNGSNTYNAYFRAGVPVSDNLTVLATDFTWLFESTVTLLPSGNDDAIQTAAVAGLILFRHTGGIGMGLWPGVDDIYSNVDCPGLTGASCSQQVSDTHVQTFISPSAITGYKHSHWKILIAHELGHGAQSLGSGIQTTNYNDNPSQPSCRCDQCSPSSAQLHCLQSREYSGAAQAEGLGHAFAVRLFNNTWESNAGFNYYKAFRNDNGSISYPPVSRDGFNPQRWRINHCNETNKGVEWDWESFFYKVSAEYAANPVTFYNLFDLYWYTCGGYCGGHDVTYTNLYNTGYWYWGNNLYEPHFQRFYTTASSHGVDN